MTESSPSPSAKQTSISLSSLQSSTHTPNEPPQDPEKVTSTQQENFNVTPAAPTIPDGGYGWVCVGACFSINCFTWGVVSSYGVYLAHYLKHSIFPGATPMDYAFIGGLNFGIAMLAAPLITALARSFGPQRPMLVGVVILVAGLISASFASQIWHLYLSQGVSLGAGVGFIYIPSVAILPQWFSRRRTLSSGITAAGSGIGGLMFSMATGAMIRNLGLGWALRITGIVAGVGTATAALVIRDRNSEFKPTQSGFDSGLLKRYDVLLLLGWGFVSMLGYITILFSLSDYAQAIGLNSSQATTVTAILNLGTAIGRPFIGVVSDRWGRYEVAGILTFVCGVSVFAVWVPATSYGVLLLFAVISGPILGVFWVAIGPLCAEIAGMELLPSLLSLAWLSAVLPTTFSEVIAVKLRNHDPSASENNSRQYLYPQIFAGLAYIVASVIMYELRRVKRLHKGF